MNNRKRLIEFVVGLLFMIFLAGCKPDQPVQPVYPNNPLNGKTTAVFNSSKSYGTVADIDGNVYKTIKIGDQVWMAENLRVTHYRNGDTIPNVKDTTAWASQTEGAYCNYNNTEDPDTIATYGRLYNWYATQDTRNIAPEGWRVANGTDWLTLINYLGGDTIASKHLKEVGTLHWDGPNDADNSSGFTALPGGWRVNVNYPIKFGLYGAFWTSSVYSQSSAPFLYLTTWHDNVVYKSFNYKVNGYSIRCIKE